MPSDLTLSRRARRERHARRRARIALAASSTLVLGLVAATGTTVALSASAAHAASAPASVPPPARTFATIEPFRSITAEAQATLDEAEAAVADASSLTAEVAESGLAIGDSFIDTARLEEATQPLKELELYPVLLLPVAVDEAAEQTRAVSREVAETRQSLNDARAQKEAEEAQVRAAAEAAAEAQRQAEEAAAEARREAEAAAAVNTPAGAKSFAQEMAAERYGWGADQFSCLVSLWERESNWNYQAYNASSGATGIPQALPGSKMASAGSDWRTNAATQIAWGLDYISAVYGAPCGAWAHSQATNWY